jgi:hypothetical protein
VEHQLRHDPEATFANLRAFNRWIEDDWGFSHQNRIIGVPMLSLVDIELCVGELERVLKAGTRIVHLRPGPVNGRSPADPNFNPFWSRVQEAGIPEMTAIPNISRRCGAKKRIHPVIAVRFFKTSLAQSNALSSIRCAL